MATTTQKTPVVKKTTAKTSRKVGATLVGAQAPVVTEVKSELGVAKYINKNLKVSPRKLRLLVTDVKKLDPATCLVRLKFSTTNAARLLSKCVADAIASAKNNHHLLASSLKFTEFRVDEGMKIKRMDKGHGSRFARGIIQKRHSRLVISLSGTIQS